jgi:hypothetical protein
MRRGGVKKPPPQAAANNAAIESRVIKGRVRWNVPSPPSGFRVTAFELRIGENDIVLASADLDLDGNYKLEFTPRLDEIFLVVVKLANAQGRVIAESSPGKQSGGTLVLNIDAGDERPQWARISSFAPDRAALDAAGIARLSIRVGLPLDDTARASNAGRLSAISGTNEELLYGMVAGGGAASAARLCFAPSNALEVHALANKGATGVFKKPDVQREIRRLKDWAAKELLKPDGRTQNPFARLLDTVGLSQGHKERVVDALLKGEGAAAFVKDLRRGGELSQADAAKLIAGTALYCALLRNDVVFERVWRDANLRGATHAHQILFDFATEDEAYWEEKIGNAEIPASIGKHGNPVRTYASKIRASLQKLAPDAPVAAVLRASKVLEHGKTIANAIQTSYKGPSPVSFATASVGRRKSFAGLSGKPLEEFRRMCRLYRVLPPEEEAAAMEALLAMKPSVAQKGKTSKVAQNKGIASARDIVKFGRESFVKAYAKEYAAITVKSAKEARPIAERVYARAAGRARTVDAIRRTFLGAASGLNRDLERSLKSVTRPLEDRARQLGIAEMLEPKSYCRCEKCSSLFSPAAYLADQLYLLETFAPEAADLLKTRHPDLWKLKLSCNNTNVAFPEIDAAIEALADVLQGGGGTQQARDTNIADSATLRIFSEYGDASSVISAFGLPEPSPAATRADLWARVYPFNLPFSRWSRIAAAYLDAGRTSFLELLEIRSPDIEPVADWWVRAQLALSTWEHTVLVGASGRGLSELWGADPADANWRDELQDLREFLRRAGLDYAALLDLADTEFLKPHANVLKRWDAEGNEADPCELEGSEVLHGLQTEIDAALDAIQGFLRLQLRLNWSIPNLDRLIRALGVTAIDGQVVRSAAHVSWLAQKLGIAVSDALVFAVGVDDRPYRGEDDSPLNLAKRAVKQSTGEEGALAMAASLPAATVRELHVAGKLPAMDLSVEAVSNARRYALLLDKLDLDVQDLLALFSLTEMGPLEEADAGARLARLVSFLLRTELLTGSALSPLELQRLLHDDASAPGRASDADIDAFLSELMPVFAADLAPVATAAVDTPTGDTASALLAEFAKLTADVARQLLDNISGRWAATSIEDLTLRKALAHDSDLSIRRNALRGFARVAAVLGSLTTDPENQKFLVQHAALFGALAVRDIALPGAAIGYEAIRRFLGLCQVLEGPEGDPVVRREALTALATDAALDTSLAERLAVGFSIGLGDVRFLGLSGTNGFGGIPFLSAADLRLRNGAYLLMRAGQYLRRINVGAETAWSWVASLDFYSDIVQSIRGAVSSQRSGTDWNRRVQDIEDRIRIATRDALVGAVMHRLRLDGDLPSTSEETLSDYLLLNLESSPNVLTSRIRLAMTAVQVFIDRWFRDWYNIALPPDSIRKRWEWARNYRLFEANRKVFFFPESWATPTNRRPVSGAFGRFAALLDQGDLSDDTIERGLTSYLDELVDIARPEIVALRSTWTSERLGNRVTLSPTVHVFGRTRAKPHKYFFRRWERCVTWTPWEPIELDIEGDHVIPAFDSRGRLFLFWATFQNRADPNKAYDIDDEKPQAPYCVYDVRMLCSQYRGRRWSRPTLSSDPITFDPNQTGVLALLLQQLNIGGESVPDVEFQRRLAFLNRASGGRLLAFSSAGGFTRDICSGTLRPVYGPFLMPSLYAPWSATPRAQAYVTTGNLRLPYEGAEWVDVLGPPPTGPYVIAPGHSDSFFQLRKVAVQDDSRSFLVSQEAGAEIIEETVTEWEPARPSSKGKKPLSFLEAQAEPLLWTEASIKESLWQGGLDRLCGIARTTVVGRTAPGGFSVIACYHPYACLFLERVDGFGVEGLYKPTDAEGIALKLPYQEISEDYFEDEYKPESVKEPYPRDEVACKAGQAYFFYDTEIFLQIPLLVGQKLSDAGEFERAHKWFRFVFDPTDHSTGNPDKDVWQIKLFRDEERLETAKDIAALLGGTSSGEDEEDAEERRRNAREQLQAWLDHPFDPHAVAALRPSAYMRLAVRMYIENLCAWGDFLFRLATPDELPIARQRYEEALWLLGSTPVELEPPKENVPSEGPTYEQLIGAALTPGEDAIDDAMPTIDVISDGIRDEPLPSFFPSQLCVPRNDKLDELREWVKLALKRLNSGLDINGEVLPTDLFGRELDPGEIIAAMQAGLPPLAALGTPVKPIYEKLRFRALIQKAMEACQEAKQAGDAVLAAAEKSDGEQLSQQRQQDQLQLLSLGIPVLGRQLDEARVNLEAQKRRQATVKARLDHYRKLKPRLPKETTQQKKMEESHAHQLRGQAVRAVGGVLVLIGDFDIGASGWAGSPVAKWRFGGLNIAKAAELAGEVFSVLSTAASNESAQAALEAQWQRRDEEWGLQGTLAGKELAEVETQLQSAELRVQLADMQLENEKARFEREKAIFDLIRDKFSSKELYDWMLQTLMPIHRALFDRAMGLANAARKAYRVELGEDAPAGTVIGQNIWDPARRGLLSADELRKRLHDLDDSYTAALQRRDNIEPERIHLRDIAPAAVQELRLFGTAEFTLPEYFFDRNPYFYRRIIRSVAVSLPNVVGPYDNVNAFISLEESRIRLSGNAESAADYRITAPTDPLRVETRGGSTVPLTHLVTSTGSEDRGGYGARPEGEGYLPFEGAGLVDSKWRITMRQDDHNFDVGNLSDVVLTFGYSAQTWVADQRDTMTDTVRQARKDSLKANGLQRLLILSQDQSEAFRRWKAGGDPLGLRFEIREELVPLGIKKMGLTVQIESVTFYVTTTGVEIPATASITVTSADGATTLGSGALIKQDSPERKRPDVGVTDPIVPPSGSPLSAFGQFRIVLSAPANTEIAEIATLVIVALQ